MKGESRSWMRSRRLVAAVLAAALVVMSPAATAPAAATQGQADAGFAGGNNPACPDPAAVARQAAGRFADIDADHVHADEIGCIAYYGITTGTGDGTRFSPTRAVLRWQMALFMIRTLQRAGVQVPAATPSFQDLGDISSAASAAVGSVSSLGIMEGRDGTRFEPGAAVRRDEMAVHLVRLLERLTGSGSAVNVAVDADGRVTLTRRDGTAVPQDDSFPDISGVSAAERFAIGAIYELGVTAGRGDGAYGPEGEVRRDQMATFLIRALGHSDLRPDGAITLAPLRPADPTGAYAGDPLRLVAHASFGRSYSLPGSDGDIFEVWLCNTPGGAYRYSTHPDNRHNPSNYADKFSGQMVAYFDWLSGGRYRPVFRAGGVVDVGSSSDYFDACEKAVFAQDLERWTQIDGVIVVVGAPIASDNVVGLASCGFYSQRSFPGNRRAVLVNGDVFTDPTVLAHEMGHALCWPHSYSGETRTLLGAVDQYDNPMDLMGWGSALRSRPVPDIGTIAINRYAAGWIPTGQVQMHELGTTKRYELEPAGGDGTQLLIVPYRAGNTTYYRALGARVRGSGALSWADEGIIAEGVEIYDVDQTTSACDLPDRGYCYGLHRRTTPIFDSDDGYNPSDADHVMQVEDGWFWVPSGDQPGVDIEVISRSGDTFTVEVKPYTESNRVSLGKWAHVSTRSEWDDTEITAYWLRSEDTGGFLDPTGTMFLRCSGSRFDVFITVTTFVFGTFDTDEVWVNYRAGTADVAAEYWLESDNDALFSPGDSSARALAGSVSDNPGRFLFRWQNAGSNDWNQLRFADTTGAKAALAKLACY